MADLYSERADDDRAYVCGDRYPQCSIFADVFAVEVIEVHRSLLTHETVPSFLKEIKRRGFPRRFLIRNYIERIRRLI